MVLKIKNLIILFFVLSILVSCATPLKESQLQSISTIGIINEFDRKPKFMIIGSTIFTNKVSKIENSEFHSHLSNFTKSYLEDAGYNVTLLDENDGNSVDLLLRLRPTSVYNAEYMEGFGVVEKFFLANPMDQ